MFITVVCEIRRSISDSRWATRVAGQQRGFFQVSAIQSQVSVVLFFSFYILFRQEQKLSLSRKHSNKSKVISRQNLSMLNNLHVNLTHKEQVDLQPREVYMTNDPD